MRIVENDMKCKCCRENDFHVPEKIYSCYGFQAEFDFSVTEL